MIEFEEEAVCYANGLQHLGSIWFDEGIQEHALTFSDFQLNLPKAGYYLSKSELDTEEKYNQAVEVFGLCGFECKTSYENLLGWDMLYANKNNEIYCCMSDYGEAKVKLTLTQLMTIGELKRKRSERDDALIDAVENTSILSDTINNSKKQKQKESYRILESMGAEWDNVEGKWFKVSKEWL